MINNTLIPARITHVWDSKDTHRLSIPFQGQTSDKMPVLQGSAPASSTVYILSNQQ